MIAGEGGKEVLEFVAQNLPFRRIFQDIAHRGIEFAVVRVHVVEVRKDLSVFFASAESTRLTLLFSSGS